MGDMNLLRMKKKHKIEFIILQKLFNCSPAKIKQLIENSLVTE